MRTVFQLRAVPRVASFFSDEDVGQARSADAIRIGDVKLAAIGADNLPAFDGGAERCDSIRGGRGFQKDHDEMARIGARLAGEGVAVEDGGEFGGGAEEKGRLDWKVPGSFGFEGGFGRFIALEKDVAALEQGADTGEAQVSEHRAQARHWNHRLAAEIDRPKKRDVDRHKGAECLC